MKRRRKSNLKFYMQEFIHPPHRPYMNHFTPDMCLNCVTAQEQREPHSVKIFSLIWKGKEESSANSDGKPPLCSSESCSTVFQMGCQPSRWMPLRFRGEKKGPENWARPSNQHKQSLKPHFPKSLMKGKWVWQRKWCDGRSQNVTRRLQSKQDFELDWKARRSWCEKWNKQNVKWSSHIQAPLPLLYAGNLCMVKPLVNLSREAQARGRREEFRFNKLPCLWSHRAQIAESAGLYVSQPCLHTWGKVCSMEIRQHSSPTHRL